MQIRVLGCSGSIAAGCRTTSYLIDQHVLVDAGTGVGDLTLDEMTAIDHILVSHSHLDHILAIGLLADSVTRRRTAQGRPPVQVHALPETLEALRRHIFNGVIWPDFTRLPSAAEPAITLHPLQVGQVLQIGQRQIEVLPARHTVPACGYAVRHLHAPLWWVFTGDTGPNDALWPLVNRIDNLKFLIIETAFPDKERRLAELALHLCPSMLAEELAKFERQAEVYITHLKPSEVELTMQEIEELAVKVQPRLLQARQGEQTVGLALVVAHVD